MRTRGEIYKDLFTGTGRPVFDAAILEALLDIRDLLHDLLQKT